MVSRYDPQKDHANLLKALSILRQKNIEFRCALVGKHIDDSNKELTFLIKKLELDSNILLLGSRSDIPTVMNGLDLHVLASSSEGFPNVVAEAMACGTPCVVTDVGDASFIVGDTGWVVPPRDSQRLADTIELAIKESNRSGWVTRSIAARQRIEKNFSIDNMIRNYNAIWQEAKRSQCV
jgi:glycosyltransferase involved in cell wall biosynthesis